MNMKYFTMSEMIRSKSAIEKRIWNGASKSQELAIEALVSNVLDPLREKIGKPITVSSGFRSEAVNKQTPGSSKSSQHMKGEAADIVVAGGPNAIFELGKAVVELGRFDQVIFEHVGKNDLLPQWIHVSWNSSGKQRGEIRKCVAGTNVYPFVSRKELGL